MKLNLLKNSLVALGLFSISTASFSAPIFTDNFDSYALGVNATNFSGNWNVSAGTIDVVGTGFFDFYPGNGNYIDLDGSTAQAGIFSSKTLNLAAGNYTLEFSLGGSQRGDTNTVNVSFGSYNEAFTLNSGDALNTFTRNVNLAIPSTVSLAFQNSGGDNLGAILGHASITPAPEPETYAMLLAGLGIVGKAVRRKKRATC
ncbi:MAG: PEP-CTERM sorting domain-containing protein [Pseudomonadota bacterium]